MPDLNTKRRCGTCTLCCRLLPVPEHGKPANTRCPHQCSKGCRIYSTRPISCAFWNCRWLAGDDTGQRPDRVGYVVDLMPDFVVLTFPGEAQKNIPVLQVWADGDTRPEKDATFLAYLEHMGRSQGMAALIRVNGNAQGYVIFPPALSANGRFNVQDSQSTLNEHTFAEIAAAQSSEMELAVVVPKDRVRQRDDE